MQLTYRGINYTAQKQETIGAKIPTDKTSEVSSASPSDRALSLDKHLANGKENNKIIQIKPIHYYTYRGVSYTKNLIFDTHTHSLLDIDRQWIVSKKFGLECILISHPTQI